MQICWIIIVYSSLRHFNVRCTERMFDEEARSLVQCLMKWISVFWENPCFVSSRFDSIHLQRVINVSLSCLLKIKFYHNFIGTWNSHLIRVDFAESIIFRIWFWWRKPLQAGVTVNSFRSRRWSRKNAKEEIKTEEILHRNCYIIKWETITRSENRWRFPYNSRLKWIGENCEEVNVSSDTNSLMDSTLSSISHAMYLYTHTRNVIIIIQSSTKYEDQDVTHVCEYQVCDVITQLQREFTRSTVYVRNEMVKFKAKNFRFKLISKKWWHLWRLLFWFRLNRRSFKC